MTMKTRPAPVDGVVHPLASPSLPDPLADPLADARPTAARTVPAAAVPTIDVPRRA